LKLLHAISETRARLNKILSETALDNNEVIERDTDRDNYMTAEDS